MSWRRWREAVELDGGSKDPLSNTLADPAAKPGCSPAEKKFLDFQTIVERVLTEETDNEWDAIRNSCPDCAGRHTSPWDHFVYHRSRATVQAPNGKTDSEG